MHLCHLYLDIALDWLYARLLNRITNKRLLRKQQDNVNATYSKLCNASNCTNNWRAITFYCLNFNIIRIVSRGFVPIDFSVCSFQVRKKRKKKTCTFFLFIASLWKVYLCVRNKQSRWVGSVKCNISTGVDRNLSMNFKRKNV